jgi:hypothetical protein
MGKNTTLGGSETVQPHIFSLSSFDNLGLFRKALSQLLILRSTSSCCEVTGCPLQPEAGCCKLDAAPASII